MDNIFSNFRNKKVIIMGLGLHGGGLESARWFVRQGARVLVTDLRTKDTLEPSTSKLRPFNIEYVLGKHRESDFRNADLIIKNPGVPNKSKFLTVARRVGVPIETDISIFLRRCTAQIIGITGTKGKSTTSALTYKLLSNAGLKPLLAGNIQISPLSILNKVTKKTPIVLELSSWQLEDIKHLRWSPHVAIITNVLPDHLDRYPSMAVYTRSKQLIVKFQSKNDYIIANYFNPTTKKIAIRSASSVSWISVKGIIRGTGCSVQNGWITYTEKGKKSLIMPIKDIKIPGEHNRENVLAAIAAVKIFKVSKIVIRQTVKSFNGIPHRLEHVRTLRGIHYYNDSAATVPDATVAALKSLKTPVTLIAGGTDKNLNYEVMAKAISTHVQFTVLLKGSATKKIEKELKKIAFDKYTIVGRVKDALQKALTHTKSGDSIVLSPGAASFELFLNEFDRGDRYKKAVRSLK